MDTVASDEQEEEEPDFDSVESRCACGLSTMAGVYISNIFIYLAPYKHRLKPKVKIQPVLNMKKYGTAKYIKSTSELHLLNSEVHSAKIFKKMRLRYYGLRNIFK